jgi:hypothetical protein
MVGKSPKFTRRHFVEIAGLISKLPKKQRETEAERYCRAFQDDNPRFERARFMKACGVK